MLTGNVLQSSSAYIMTKTMRPNNFFDASVPLYFIIATKNYSSSPVGGNALLKVQKIWNDSDAKLPPRIDLAG